MTTAISLAADVYNQANTDQTLSTFSTTQEWPYSIALTLLNESIDMLNQKGRYRFMLTNPALSNPPPNNSNTAYSLSTIGVDSEGITEVERTTANYYGSLTSMTVQQFRRHYRRSAITSGQPIAWTDYGDVLELSHSPDIDYGLQVWHYAPITRVAATTDVISVPTRHEHILKNMMLALLAQRIGRADFETLLGLAIKNADEMVVNTQQLRSRATRMPANF